MQKQAIYNSPLGKITILADDNYLLGLWFEQQKHFGANFDLQNISNGDNSVTEQTKNWLKKYFADQNPEISQLPLKPKVTEYRAKILDILQTIPFGSVWSYQEIAQKYNQHSKQKTSARAVGGAVGHNPISIIIPCHRVVASDGDLTGYAGGIDRKIALLKLEGFDEAKLIQHHV